MKKVSLSLVALAVSSILVGCGGSDDDSSSNNKEQGKSYSIPTEGQFVDAKVQGLHYKSGSKSGVTDGDAKYSVDTSNPTVTFSIGGEHGLEIGTISAREVSTPFEAAGTYERSVNLARLLLTIDNNPSDDSIIVIPAALQNLASSDAVSSALQQISLDSDYFESSLASLLSELGLTTSDIVSAEEAISHMKGSLGDWERGSEATLKDWAKGSGAVFIGRSAGLRISPDGTDYTLVVHANEGSTPKMTKMVFQLTTDNRFLVKAGSNDSVDSSTYSELAKYTFVTLNESKKQTEDEYANWDHVSAMGGVYECMFNSNCTEQALTKFQLIEDRDDSDDDQPAKSELRDETISGSYDPITGVYTQVRSKETVTSAKYPSNVGRVEESIDFVYQVDSATSEKYVDFIGTWKAISTMPECDKVAESTYVFTSTEVTVSGQELGGSGSSCTLDDISGNLHYEELATKDYWWFTTNSAGNSKATLDQLNTTVRWNDRDDGDTSDYFKINRFSYIPAGKNWDQGVLVRDTLDDSGTKTATTIMRKISQ